MRVPSLKPSSKPKYLLKAPYPNTITLGVGRQNTNSGQDIVPFTANAIPIKIPSGFLEEIDKLIVRLIWNCRGYRIAKAILKKKNKAGGLKLPAFKTYYKAPRDKTVWYWHTDRHTDR